MDISKLIDIMQNQVVAKFPKEIDANEWNLAINEIVKILKEGRFSYWKGYKDGFEEGRATERLIQDV